MAILNICFCWAGTVPPRYRLVLQNMAELNSTQDFALSATNKNQMENIEEVDTPESSSVPQANLVARVELTEEDVWPPSRDNSMNSSSDGT